MTKHPKIYFVDGSSIINGEWHNSAYAIFKNNKIIKQIVIPKEFNCYEIESMAILDCLIMAKGNSIIYCDNQQIINELNGEVKKPKDPKFCERAIALMKNKKIKVEKIKRDENLAGIYLEGRIKKIKGKYLRKYLNESQLRNLRKLKGGIKKQNGKNNN